MEQLHYAPLSEAITGALLLHRMSQFLDLSIQSNIFSKDKDTAVELFVRVIEAAYERGVQHNHYVTNCPDVVEIGDGRSAPMWEYALIHYLQTIEDHSHHFEFNDTAQLAVIKDSRLVDLIETTYDKINNDIGCDLDLCASAIATSENDYIMPVTRLDNIYLEEGFDGFSDMVQKNLYLVESFLCDTLGLPRKEGTHCPAGFSRRPSPSKIYIDEN